MELENTFEPKRILVIRRNRMGDMICTVPLLHALRRHFPATHIAVACDKEGMAVAQACPAVDDVRVLSRGLIGTAMNAMRLRGYDAVIAAKGGFDNRLARLTRLTDAPVRIGFQSPGAKQKSSHYTHRVSPSAIKGEHQIETCLRLLEPLGITDRSVDLTLRLPDEAVAFAKETIQQRRDAKHRHVVVLNISSNRPIPLSVDHLTALIRRLETHGALVAISCLPSKIELARAHRLAARVKSSSTFVLETPDILQLGAVIQKSAFLFTPEGGVGHLAAALGTPALVLWSEGPFEKWKTWADNHHYLRLDQRTSPVTVDDVWDAMPVLHDK